MPVVFHRWRFTLIRPEIYLSKRTKHLAKVLDLPGSSDKKSQLDLVRPLTSKVSYIPVFFRKSLIWLGHFI